MLKRFSVWNGTSISSRWNSVAEIAQAVRSLKPKDYHATPEWLVKAGEFGSWQSTWDNSRFAVDGPQKITDLHNQTIEAAGVRTTPYVVLRSNESFGPLTTEWEFIYQCAQATPHHWVVCNLEPGLLYWNGPVDLPSLDDHYIGPMWEYLKQRCQDDGWDVSAIHLEVTCIPRQGVINQLGGDEVMRHWLQGMNSASWECYGIIAPGESPDSLTVDAAIPRVDAWAPDTRGRWRIPLVQRDEVQTWYRERWARYGMQVWHLDGNW